MWLYELYLNSMERNLCPYSYNSLNTATFINAGKTDGVLHSYRKLELENEKLFEKVYFKDGIEWEKTELFYRYVFPRLEEENVKVPALVDVREGKSLVITYCEYLNLESVKEEHYFEESTDMAARLANLNLDFNSIPSKLISDYTAEPVFYTKNDSFRNSLTDADPERLDFLDQVNKYIQRYQNKRLNHGDLNRGNIFRDGKIIDWDRFGLYPIGYDFAYIVSKIDMEKKLTLDLYRKLESQSYAKVSGLTSEVDFKITMAFFTASFLWYGSGDRAELSHELLKLLEDRFQIVQA